MVRPAAPAESESVFVATTAASPVTKGAAHDVFWRSVWKRAAGFSKSAATASQRYRQVGRLDVQIEDPAFSGEEVSRG
eukprot:1403238-Rhodomonas_salina.1